MLLLLAANLHGALSQQPFLGNSLFRNLIWNIGNFHLKEVSFDNFDNFHFIYQSIGNILEKISLHLCLCFMRRSTPVFEIVVFVNIFHLANVLTRDIVFCHFLQSGKNFPPDFPQCGCSLLPAWLELTVRYGFYVFGSTKGFVIFLFVDTFHISDVFLDQMDFAVFPVSRHFPYSKNFASFLRSVLSQRSP